MGLPHLYTIRSMNDIAAYIDPIIPPAAAPQRNKDGLKLVAGETHITRASC